MKIVKVGGGVNQADNPPDSAFQEGLIHPLFNDIILSELMSFLAVSDLRQCRLVNPTWNTAATPYLKKNAWLKSYKRSSGIGDELLDGSSKYLDNLCFSDLSRELELTELGRFGIQNLSVYLTPFLQSSTAEGNLLSFLDDYREEIKTLDVFVVSVDSQTLELLAAVLLCLSNLKALKLRALDFSFGPSSLLPNVCQVKLLPGIQQIDIVNEKGYPQVNGNIEANNHYEFLKRLLQTVPNLKRLKLLNSDAYGVQKLQMEHWVWKASEGTENPYLRLLKDEGKALCPRLKDLFLSDYLSSSDLKLILDMDIHFRQIGIPVLIQSCQSRANAIPDPAAVTLSLLERHQSTLEVLELQISLLTDEDDHPLMYLKFPFLPNLKKMLIELDVDEEDDSKIINFDPLNYKIQFPALKELCVLFKLDDVEENVTTFERRLDLYNQLFPNDGQVCQSLQRLSLEIPDPELIEKKKVKAVCSQFISRLDLLFPNVHNHEKVNASRAKQLTELNEIEGNESHRVTRSKTKIYN